MGYDELNEIKKAQLGNQRSFELVMNHYLTSIYNYVIYQVSQVDDAQDIIQDVMLSAYQGLKRYEYQSSMKTWLMGITRRKIADFYREKYKKQTVPLDNDIGVDKRDSVLNQLSIASVIKSLSEEEQELIHFVFMQGLTYQEISDVMEIPVGTVKSRMYMVKQKLKELLKDDWRNLYG